MTAFEKSNFEYHGGYLHYNTGAERRFVARFKHRGPVTKAKFQAALIKHYSIETYFARLGADPAAGCVRLPVALDAGSHRLWVLLRGYLHRGGELAERPRGQ